MKSEIVLFLLSAVGLGVGYSAERASQHASLVAFVPRREPAWVRELDPSYQHLVKVLNQKGFSIDENPKVCKQFNIVGFYTWQEKTIKVCTNRIASLNSDPMAFRQLLQQTITHEAAHVAQSCRHKRQGRPSLELARARLYALPSSVKSDIDKALTYSRYVNTRSLQWRIEAEAMELEDKPVQVIAALRSFCT